MRAFAAAALAVFAVLASRAAVAVDIPVPCGGAPPKYAAPGPNPEVRVFYGDELGAKWAPHACVGWEPANVAILLVTAGSFRFSGSADDIVARLGAISRFHDILYWSHTRQGWRPLMPESYALAGPDPALKRDDFTAQEMMSGAPLYFYQTAAGRFAYQLQVREHDKRHVVVTMENITGFQMLFLPVFKPGDARLVYFLERGEGDVWNFYQLTALKGLFTPFMRSGEPSFINRVAAIFRYAAGIQTDADPPLARE